MTEKPSFEVRYSEKFLRDKQRRDQRTRLFGTVLMLFMAIVIFKDTADAIRAHTWVNVASRINQQILVPPFIAGLLGLAILGIGLFLAWEHIRRRK